MVDRPSNQAKQDANTIYIYILEINSAERPGCDTRSDFYAEFDIYPD